MKLLSQLEPNFGEMILDGHKYISHAHQQTTMKATAGLSYTWNPMGNSIKNLLYYSEKKTVSSMTPIN